MSAKKINCPHCKKTSLYSQENPYRPFCSERCQLIDLGAWASEKFRVPSAEPVDTEILEKELRRQGDGDIQ